MNNDNDNDNDNVNEIRTGPPRLAVVSVAKAVDKVIANQMEADMDTVTMSRLLYEGWERQLESARLDRQAIEKLAVFLREHYALEIRAKEPQHRDGTAVDAAIHYLSIERSRVRVKIKHVWAAIFRYSKG